jgi:plastocyanin domain-containing protein
MSKASIYIVALVVVIGLAVYYQGDKVNVPNSVGSGSNIDVREGIQYINISANGGYSPRASKAKVGLPTKIVVKTEDTYDCSSALVISKIGYQKALAPTGEEVIDIGTPEAGSLQGVCGMGMYSFTIYFVQ